MNGVKKFLIIGLFIVQSAPLLPAERGELNIFQKAYGVLAGLFMGSVTGVTSAMVDYNSGGRLAPASWLLSSVSRAQLKGLLTGSNTELNALASKAGEYSAWITYGAALLFLNNKPSVI